MAWIFSLSAECGANKDLAEHFAKRFKEKRSYRDDSGCTRIRKPNSLSANGRYFPLHTAVFQDQEKNWWFQVFPGEISTVGVVDYQTADLMTKLGIQLYQILRQLLKGFNSARSPQYLRYGLVGVEVDEFRTFSELIDDSSAYFPGLVLAETLWRSLGSPPAFQPFAPGYLWIPYGGEVEQSLSMSEDLKRQLEELVFSS